MLSRLFHFFFSLFLTLILFCECVFSTPLNLHLKLDPHSESFAISIDTALHPSLPHDLIDFHTLHQPHITLYLTDFGEKTDEVVSALEALSPDLSSLKVPLGGYDVSGNYAFWKVKNTQRLQWISDALVNATHHLIAPNQTIPDWVKALPEPLRSIKIRYIQKYGSPNVFDQFVPHVTVLFDTVDPSTSLASAIDALPKYESLSNLCVLGVGSVGDGGTVLRGKDFADFDLKKKLGRRHHRKPLRITPDELAP